MKTQQGFVSAGILIAILLGFSVLGGGGYYYYTHTDEYISKYGKTLMVDGPLGGKVAVHTGQKLTFERKTKGRIVSAEDGWSRYTSNEWGLTFQYPSNWKLTEMEYNKEYTGGDQLASVQIVGDGYSLDFNNIGRGYPTGDTTIVTKYVVDGKEKRAFEDKFGDEFWQAMGACDVALEISRPTESKEITDKVIASVKCLAAD